MGCTAAKPQGNKKNASGVNGPPQQAVSSAAAQMEKKVDLRDVKLDVKLLDDQPKFEQVAAGDTPPDVSDDEEENSPIIVEVEGVGNSAQV